MESLAKKVHIEKIKEDNAFVEFTFSEDNNIDAGKLFKIAYKVNDKFTFEYKSHRIIMRLNVATIDKKWINMVIKVLEEYTK